MFERQVEAFNAHDIDAFLATYSHDAVVAGVTPEPLRGADALRAHYTPRLADPSLDCRVLATATFGDRWLVAHELVSSATSSTEVIAVFECAGGLICRSSITLG